MINPKDVAEKLYNILLGFGLAVDKYDSDGNITVNTAECRRYAVKSPNIIVRFSPETQTITLQTGPGELPEKIRDMIKMTASDNLYNFDYTQFTKKITPRGEAAGIQKAKDGVMENEIKKLLKLAGLSEAEYNDTASCENEEQMGDVLDYQTFAEGAGCPCCGDGPCNCASDCEGCGRTRVPATKFEITMEGFGSMTGSSKTSYQALENVKLVIRHAKAVNEETRGSRSRNIKEIYIQRGDERFKMAENNLKASRAMARHIQQGGEMFDAVGESIVDMAREQRKLKEFVRYVNKRGLVNERNSDYITLAKQNINDISESFRTLASAKSYANAIDTLQSRNNVQPLEEDNIQELFTETHFDDRVAEAMDSLRGAVSRDRAYQAAVTEAISSEIFAGFRETVVEAELLTYESHNHKLAQRVRSLGLCTESSVLRGFLKSVSYKISESQRLSAFETSSVRDCISKLRNVTESVKTDPLDNLYATLSKYDY